MRDFWMTAYVLVWPVLVAVMMFIMGRGVYRDFRRAKRSGDDMV